MSPNDVGQILDRLARIEVTVENVAEDVTEVKGLASKTNGRVTALEKARERDKGFIAAVSLLVPIVTAIVTAWAISALF